MNSREKRSNGGYGLRRKIAKKRLDEDFEYYCAGAGSHVETSTSTNVAQGKQDDKLQTHVVVVTKLVNPQEKAVPKDEYFEKKPRGRPRKYHVAQKDILDISSSSSENMSKNLKSCKVVENVDVTKIDEIKEVSLVSVTQEVKVGHLEAVNARNAKLGILTADEMAELPNEEVSLLPEGEKENLPGEDIHLITEPDMDDKMDINIEETKEEYTQGLIYGEYDKVGKGPPVLLMKSKKENISSEDIQKLNNLNPDDKIECSECHKLLKPSSFRQHLRTHTGEKPFRCEVCEARFTRKGDVERHVRIVHNKQKPFKCTRCHRAFGDKKNLRWHLLNHDKKLFYVCEVCGFKFGKQEYWENHVRYIHPVKGALDLDDNYSAQITAESEDSMHSLTAHILGADELSENGTNQALVLKSEEKKPETVITAVPLPLFNQLSEQGGFKVINVKGNLNLLKLNFSKKQEKVRVYGQAVSASKEEGIEAVVIEVDDHHAGSSSDQSEYVGQPPSNVIHIVNSSEVLPVANIQKNELQKNQKLVIETKNSKEDGKQVQEERGLSNSVQYVCDENAQPSKMISFMLTDSSASTSDEHNAPVQTLIEALLVAAKGDGQQKESQST